MARFVEGRCPVHGIEMTRFEKVYNTGYGMDYGVFGCPRKDCGIDARLYLDDLWLELMPNYAYLLEQSDEGTAKIIPFKPLAHKNNTAKNPGKGNAGVR